MRVLDLDGTDGNAFAVVGIVSNVLNQLDVPTDKINIIKKLMFSGNYIKLVTVAHSLIGDLLEFDSSQESLEFIFDDVDGNENRDFVIKNDFTNIEKFYNEY